MKIIKENFGKLKSGEEVIKYSLINNNGFKINILNYGGIITEIMAPDKEGAFENIVLGFDNIRDYEEKSPYFGGIIGRNAGRISNAKFVLDGQEYILAKNYGENNLHGGIRGFDKVIWDTKCITENDSIGVEMGYLSHDGEEGFPGNLDVKITYIINNDNELEIKYNAVSDKRTIINLTNHSYFNLSGNLKRDILDHKLTISSGKVVYVNEKILPTGEIVDVRNTVFDFRKAKSVGRDMYKQVEQLNNCGGYDHPFVLNKNDEFSTQLEDEKSGRVLEVTTDQPIIVLYTGNTLGEELVLNRNRKCKKYLGLCLETQDYPDSINQDDFPKTIYNPGEKYKAYTKYKFYINQ